METPLRLVLFDFDGTLCDSATTIIRIMQQACQACDLPIPDADKIRGNIGHGISHSALNYVDGCLLYTSPSPRDLSTSRMPSSA